MRPRQTLLALSIVVIFTISSLVVAQPSWKLTSSDDDNSKSVTITVFDAYYGDLDGDGFEDDVYAEVNLVLEGANRYNFDYWLTLILPSGQEFTFGWGVNTRLTNITIANNLYDTALEPGWYDLHVEVIMKTGGVTYHDSTHTFDPPGEGDTGVPPSASFELI